MCGIFGYLNGDHEKKADVNLTRTFIKKQNHRGPDDFGSYSCDNFAVSHNRLSIIDLSSNGRQPMQNAAGTITVAFNGEIYNFRELRSQYSLEDNFKFKSRTDTEVILYLYEMMGIDFVNKLNGMFAIALWDSRISQLLLIRDRFGIKPLFYTILNDSIWFSSEIKSLLCIPGFDRRICFKAIHNYFSFDYIPGEDTAFENIKEIRPGHLMKIKSGNSLDIAIKQYWTAEYGSTKPLNIKDTVNEIKELLINSVRSQLVSDVPVGVMLSGGMDSSTLTALMAHVRGNPDFHTFSVVFDEPSFNESKYATIVAKHVGTMHHDIKITPETITANLEKCLSIIDEPYADGSAIPTYMLSQEAKNYVSVLLSGEGGDEVFAGYSTHKAYLFNRLYRKLPKQIKWLASQCVDLLPVSHKKLSFDYKAKKFMQGTDFSIPQCHYMWREVFSEADKKDLFKVSWDMEREYGASYSLFVDFYNKIDCEDELNKLLYLDCSFHLPDDLMIKNDRMTMAHSVEARVPFTDYVLFDYMSKISGSSKMQLNNSKFFLKKAMMPFLPDTILHKKKIGLEIPYSIWFCKELKELMLSYLSRDSLLKTPFINADYVQQIIKEHLTYKKDNGRELWGLLNFVVWHELYFSGSIPQTQVMP
jgi:asparagine synthase (glutamine-hydrolysing)